jgi:hypothetical protein
MHAYEVPVHKIYAREMHAYEMQAHKVQACEIYTHDMTCTPVRYTAALLTRIYVFAAFDGRWPGVTFLIFALSGNLALGPIAPGTL